MVFDWWGSNLIEPPVTNSPKQQKNRRQCSSASATIRQPSRIDLLLNKNKQLQKTISNSYRKSPRKLLSHDLVSVCPGLLQWGITTSNP